MPHKILIADDSKVDAMALAEAVTTPQCTVFTALSGPEAVKIARAESPDIIFLDIVMGEMSGYDVCRIIKTNEKTGSVPIVFVSSKCSKADAIWARKQGGAALIGKPFTKKDIMDQLQNILDLNLSSSSAAIEDSAEMVMYKGVAYPRFHGGLEFNGVYRGRPSYK